jgi:hypothetical protein
MAKKVMSFTLDREPYEALFKMFKENYVDVSISSYLNRAIKELLTHLQSVQDEVKRLGLKVPMSYVIETAARGTLFKALDSEAAEGVTESSLERQAREYQRKYDLHVGKNPEEAEKYDVDKIDKNVPFSAIVKYLTDSVLEEIGRRGRTTDDDYIDRMRKIGGKGLEKKLREDIAPFVQKIDPPVGEVVKKIVRKKKAKNVEED